MTILLGVLVLAFLVPVGFLFAGSVALILGRMEKGIAAGTGGFSFVALSVRKTELLLVLIVALAAFISWLTQKILRRQNSRR
jgi:hypothetical protein